MKDVESIWTWTGYTESFHGSKLETCRVKADVKLTTVTRSSGNKGGKYVIDLACHLLD